MTFSKIGFITVATVLGACSTADRASVSMASIDGMTYQEMRAQNTDLSAVEFAVIDTNNDYVVDADEEDRIDITIDD